jgi:hypothetical protein
LLERLWTCLGFDGLSAVWIGTSNADRVLPFVAQPLGLARLGVALIVLRSSPTKRELPT